MNREKISFFANIAVLAIASLVICYVGVKYIVPVVLPFVIAWGIAFITRRPAAFLSRKTGVGVKFYRPALALIFMLLLIGGVSLAMVALLGEAWQFFGTLAEDGRLASVIENITNSFFGIFGELGIGSELGDKIFDALSGILADVLGKIASLLTAVVSSVPKILFFLLITAISTVYFALDLEKINSYVHSILPKKVDAALVGFKERSLCVLLKYLRSYFLIMLLTFAIMLLGLTVLRVDYALLLSFVIALLDILPAIGVGVILIPFGVFMLVTGNTYVGIGLLILTAVSTVVRQIAEPKILGKNLGIHPLLTLILMYVGYTLFGIVGLVFLPLLGVLFTKKDTAEIKKD